jgi:hypothetical protein
METHCIIASSQVARDSFHDGQRPEPVGELSDGAFELKGERDFGLKIIFFNLQNN